VAQKMDPLDFKRGLGGPPQDVTDAPTPLDIAGSPQGPGGKEGKVTLQTLDSKLDAIMDMLSGGPGAPPSGPPAPMPGGGPDIMSLLGGLGGPPGGPPPGPPGLPLR
jgi:hypothetical protein